MDLVAAGNLGGGGQGGIGHSSEQFTKPMAAWRQTFGSPELTPEVQRELIDGLHAAIGSRPISDLEAQRDEVLLGLLELRSKSENSSGTTQIARAIQGSAGRSNQKSIRSRFRLGVRITSPRISQGLPSA
jgi:hypothetical protein